MAICGTASTWVKVAALLLIVAIAMQAAGVGTHYWEERETKLEKDVYIIGLWRVRDCTTGTCKMEDIPDSYINGSFQAVRVFECMILFLAFIAAVMALMYVCSEGFRERIVAIIITALCFVGVTFGIIATILWAVQVPDLHYLGYSFGLAVIAFCAMFFAGILMIPDIRRYQSGRSDVKKVRPSPRRDTPMSTSKYDDIKRQDYSYNRKFSPAPPAAGAAAMPDSNVKHYYNPNREVYQLRSPPPSYRANNTPDYNSRYSTRGYSRTEIRRVGTRTEIHTPDMLLARPRKY